MQAIDSAFYEFCARYGQGVHSSPGGFAMSERCQLMGSEEPDDDLDSRYPDPDLDCLQPDDEVDTLYAGCGADLALPDPDGDVLWWGLCPFNNEYECSVLALVDPYTSKQDAVRILRKIANWVQDAGLPPIDLANWRRGPSAGGSPSVEAR